MLALCFLCMAAIFIFSSLPGPKSSQQSGTITGMLSIFFVEKAFDKQQDIIQFIVRKIAHIVEFALLSGLWYGYFCETSLSKKKRVGFAFCISFLYAVSDEIHQSFILGRAARIYDVGFDTIGIILGILAVVSLYRLVDNRKAKLIKTSHKRQEQ